MVFLYSENINVDVQISNRVEFEIQEMLSVHFNLCSGYLDTIKFVTEDFFEDNVAALVEPKDKIIYLGYESFFSVFINNLSTESEEYKTAFNSLLHEYVHLENYYNELVASNQYIEKMDISEYVKCSIITLVDEYKATYRSGKIIFSKNEIHKILPSMCKYISLYKGKKETPLYWQVIRNLGIGIAHDTLVLEREGYSQYCIDVNHEDVIAYKELILKIRSSLIEFNISNRLSLLDDMRFCVETLCEIFGMDKHFLKKIDELKRI